MKDKIFNGPDHNKSLSQISVIWELWGISQVMLRSQKTSNTPSPEVNLQSTVPRSTAHYILNQISRAPSQPVEFYPAQLMAQEGRTLAGLRVIQKE